MHEPGLHEVLARDRRRYERLLLSKIGAQLSAEDAEDIVSDALIRLESRLDQRPPKPGKEDAWFARVVLNRGVDFLRARDGRKRPGSRPRPIAVPFDEMAAGECTAADDAGRGPLDELAEEAERHHARELVARAMATLEPQDAELIRLRHVVAPQARRDLVAEMAGMTVSEFRRRYARAWERFVEAVAADAPSPRCQPMRQLLADVQAGTAPPEAAAAIDAHTLDCASCRVFARESYRALEIMPVAPAAGFAERWTSRVSNLWDRSGPEATAGAGTAAAGAGLWGLLGGSSTAGLVKAIAIVCSATAVTAGICAGVAEVIEQSSKRPSKTITRARDPDPSGARKTRSPVAPPSPLPTRVATAAATTTPRPRPQPAATGQPRQTTADTSGASAIPASAPEGSSEFSPGGPSAPVEPAPATDSGGGEFTP